MKVLIFGDFNKAEDESVKKSLSSVFTDRIDAMIERGDELLVGSDRYGFDRFLQDYLRDNMYKNVTVAVSGSKRSRQYNSGGWEEHYYSCNGRTVLTRKLERFFGMAEDADCGLVSWNKGSDNCNTENLIIILSMLALEKKCDIYHINENRWSCITSMDNVNTLLDVPKDFRLVKENVLSECGFSDEMIRFLTPDESIDVSVLMDYVYCAPVSLINKELLYSRIAGQRNINGELFNAVRDGMEAGRSFRDIKKSIRQITDFLQKDSVWTDSWDMYQENRSAYEALTQCNAFGEIDTVFYLYDMWYDTEVFLEKKYGCGMFLSIDNALEYIKNEEKIDQEDDSDEADTGEWEYGGSWYLLELWEIDFKTGKMEHKYQYYIYKGEVCWFDEMRPRLDEETGNVYYSEKSLFAERKEKQFHHRREHSLETTETPFKTGDVIRVDCRPFGPPFNALVLESEDQFDYIYPTVVFRVPYTEEWRIEPLKSRRYYKQAESFDEPKLSPVYRLRSVADDELKGEDKEFLDLRRMLSGKRFNASKVWDLWRTDTHTKDEMKKIFVEACTA